MKIGAGRYILSVRLVLSLALLVAAAGGGARAGHAAASPSPVGHEHAAASPSDFGHEHAASACTAAPAAARGAAAITWNPVEIKCPLCGTTNTFLQWGSYGSYIYSYPSKFQYVFWPYTDSPVVYSCKQCRLTTFMDDFEKTPKEKFEELRKVLAGVSLPAVKSSYTEIPMPERLLAAEKVYRALGRTDEDFWGHFYRVLGYHYDAKTHGREAAAARKQALASAERLLADKANEPRRKELLYAAGAMRHFLNDDAGALRDFEAAAALAYADKDLKPEQAKNVNDYLNGLLAEYVEKIKKGDHPRDKAARGHDH